MHIIVLVTAKDKQQAQKIARGLLESKLIACANIVPGIESMFRWKGKIESANEALLILKTKKSLFKKLEAKVKALHSYDTPEIIAIDLTAGNGDYLKWITDVTS